MYDIRSEDNGCHPWEGSDKEGRSRLLEHSFAFLLSFKKNHGGDYIGVFTLCKFRVKFMVSQITTRR